MSVLVSAQCSNCGAHLKLESETTSVVCPFCGKTFLLRPLQPVVPSGTRGSSKRANAAIIVAFLLALGVGGVVALVSLVVGSKRVPPTENAPVVITSSAALLSPPPAAPPVPAVLESVEFDTNRGLLFANVNNDATVDAIHLVTVKTDKERFDVYAAFDGSTGNVLWKTPPLENNASSLYATVAYERLLVVDESGQLTGYDVSNGALQWTTALGERWYAFCNTKEPESVNVITMDERSIAVNVKTGKQGNITQAKGCDRSRVDRSGHERNNPRDRRDYDAPPGIKAIRCGATRVMGSENYHVPDACAAATHVDSDDMNGISASALWYVNSGLLVLGVKTPGSHVPMLGLWSKGHLAWKVEVPEGNPLDCDGGGVRPTTLIEDRVITTYTNKKTEVSTLTAFALANGHRLWSTRIPKDFGEPRRLAFESGQLWVEIAGRPLKDALFVLNAKNGQFRFGVTSGNTKVLASLETTP